MPKVIPDVKSYNDWKKLNFKEGLAGAELSPKMVLVCSLTTG